MKKNNQIYILLIISVLAVVIFLYYTHRLKITEGAETLDDYSAEQADTDPIRGDVIPMSEGNLHTVTSVLEDLENDFDSDVPKIKAEEVRLSQRINALDGRISEFEKNMPDDEEYDDEEDDDEEDDDKEENDEEYTITPAVSIKYGGHK
jgi:hypothetical protein